MPAAAATPECQFLSRATSLQPLCQDMSVRVGVTSDGSDRSHLWLPASGLIGLIGPTRLGFGRPKLRGASVYV